MKYICLSFIILLFVSIYGIVNFGPHSEKQNEDAFFNQFLVYVHQGDFREAYTMTNKRDTLKEFQKKISILQSYSETKNKEKDIDIWLDTTISYKIDVYTQHGLYKLYVYMDMFSENHFQIHTIKVQKA